MRGIRFNNASTVAPTVWVMALSGLLRLSRLNCSVQSSSFASFRRIAKDMSTIPDEVMGHIKMVFDSIQKKAYVHLEGITELLLGTEMGSIFLL